MFCQKCKIPLKPDSSLDNLNPTSFNLLTEASSTYHEPGLEDSLPTRPLYTQQQKDLYDRVSKNSPVPIVKRHITPVHHGVRSHAQAGEHGDTPPNDHNPAMSFIMLSDSQVVPPPPREKKQRATVKQDNRRRRDNSAQSTSEEDNLLSHKMETTTRLFEILSSRSDIDHPICMECTELLVEGMEKRLANATRERDAYVDFLKNANADVPTDEERHQAQQELKAVREEEEAALAELEQLEAEKAALEEELAALDREARDLDEEEEAFWRERNAFAQVLSSFQNERDSVNMRYDHDARQLERLQRTNVYNDTFCISHNGVFVTINNLRLGRVANHPVEWAEINAAWGQTCLLLATVAEKLGYTLQGYRLNPMGSTSTIDKITEPSPQASMRETTQNVKTTTTSLPLYYSSELPLGIGFLHRNFDNAMVALLECIRQLGKHVERTTQGTETGGELGLRLPYEIKKDRINDTSIKLGTFSTHGDDSWTKACKLTLTCCKFLLAHASNVGGSRRGPS